MADLQRTTDDLGELLAAQPLALLADGAALAQRIAQQIAQAQAVIAADPMRWGG